MKTVDYKIAYFLSGEPKNGKTTIANKFNIPVIALDELFLQYYNSLTGTDHRGKFSIFHTWPNLTDSQKKDFGLIIETELNKFINSPKFEIVVDGWLLIFFKDALKHKFADSLLVCDINVSKYCCYIDKLIFRNEKKCDIEKNIIIPIKYIFARHIMISLKVNYHWFESFGFGNPLQKSLDKYTAFNLDSIVKDKNILDIGCNSGYNCFKMAETAYTVTGIDILPEALKNAAIINNIKFRFTNIKFILCNLFDFNVGSFDVILASSIIHYFVGEQQNFIDKCFELLNAHGTLVLELGIADNKIIKRSDGITCEYPSEDTLITILCKNFILTYKSPSVNQLGDSIPRFIYHFHKKQF